MCTMYSRGLKIPRLPFDKFISAKRTLTTQMKATGEVRNTAKVLQEHGVKAIRTNKLEQPAPNLMDLILGHKIDLVIDTPEQGVEHAKDGFIIRRNAIETGVNVLTSLDTARALVTSLENTDSKKLNLIDIAAV